jgi:lipid-A-disaccharide synthase
VLPGSRGSEVDRLMPPFGEAVGLLAARCGPLDVRLPTLPHVEARVRAQLKAWPIQPTLVFGEADKLALFRVARAALAASGTATLELALAGVPMVGAYRVSALESLLRYIVVAPSILLPNLVLGERAIPELLQEGCTPEALAAAIAPLIEGGAERSAQIAALARVEDLMRLPGGMAPSEAAARATLETILR